jgi:hypothetical protein
MVQQYYYKEFSLMKKRVDKILTRSHRLRLIKQETESHDDHVEYLLKFKWSWLNFIMFNKIIRLKLAKVDETITRIELHVIRNGEEKDPGIFIKSTDKALNNLLGVF